MLFCSHQLTGAATGGREFSLSFTHRIFHKLTSQKSAKGIYKLSIAEKVRIISWQEYGVLKTVIAHSCRRCRSSIKHLPATVS